MDFAVLGTLKNNRNGETKNIYYRYHCDGVSMEWLDDERININGITLNVAQNEIYDDGEMQKYPRK